MTLTRSQAATEARTSKVFEVPPASPSAQLSASASASVPAGTTSRAHPEPNPRAPALPTQTTIDADRSRMTSRDTAAAATNVEINREERRSRAASARSQRSSATVVARIKQAELDAQERLADIQRRELQLEATLIKKRLALEIATIREETDRQSVSAHEAAEVEHRVSDWLKNVQHRGGELTLMTSDLEMSSAVRASAPFERRGERTEREPPREIIRQQSQHSFFQYPPQELPKGVTIETPQRPRSPTPVRSRERGIDRLAEAIERMARRRPPPKQAQELPNFSGAPNEWLLFRSAMRDSTKMYGFTQAENLARLRISLKGEARETVAALLYTATDPAVIMQTLEQCYGRPEIIIDRALNDIQRLQRPGGSASELNAFAIKLQNIVSVLSSIDERGYLQNPMLARQVTEKLSPHIRTRWCDYADEYGCRSEPEIVTLSRFLMREADRAIRFTYSVTTNVIKESTRSTTAAKGHNTPMRQQNERRRNAAAYTATENKTCLCCGAEHDAAKCKKLEAMTIPKRWEWAKEARVCFRCLSNRHHRASCTAKKCGVDECRHPHHVLLHGTERAVVGGAQKEQTIAASTHTVMSTGAVLLKVCPVTIQGPDGLEVETYALLDEGSTITLIDEEIARTVNAHGTKCALRLHGLWATQQEPDSESVNLVIRGARTNSHPMKARTVKSLNINSQKIAASCLNYEHLEQLPPNEVCYANARPRVLIGADNWHLIVSRKLLIGEKNEPAASLTQLGWVVHGTVPRTIVAKEDPKDGVTVLHVRAPEHRDRTRRDDEEQNELVKAHFTIDALGIASSYKPVKEVDRGKVICKTALHWIKNDSARYTPYVTHRLSEIAELTPAERWRWVPTAQNVADDATRGRTRLTQNDRLFTGPAFLREPEENWPIESNQSDEEQEMTAHIRTDEGVIDVTRFSSYERMLRAVAYVHLFIDKCRRRATALELKHIDNAERTLIREAQRASFPQDIKRLASGSNVERSSRLLKLDPVYDSDRIIRLNGRIDAANVPENRKRPPILDGRHPLVSLLIRHEHVKNGHAGREHIVNNIRQRYWVLRLRAVVRTTLNECIVCKIRRTTPPIPVKGNLPNERLDAYSRPLTHVSMSPEDTEALTPNHFLIGSAVGLPVTGTCDVADKRAWRTAQALADRFWARWVNEYQPTLAPRGDVRKNNVDQIKTGDVVIIADGLLPRNVWPRGQVERVVPGPDGVVRSVDVRTRGGIYRRPVRRLIILDRGEEARDAMPGGDC